MWENVRILVVAKNRKKIEKMCAPRWSVVRARTDLAVKFKIATQSPGVKTGLSSLETKIISDWDE